MIKKKQVKRKLMFSNTNNEAPAKKKTKYNKKNNSAPLIKYTKNSEIIRDRVMKKPKLSFRLLSTIDAFTSAKQLIFKKLYKLYETDVVQLIDQNGKKIIYGFNKISCRKSLLNMVSAWFQRDYSIFEFKDTDHPNQQLGLISKYFYISLCGTKNPTPILDISSEKLSGILDEIKKNSSQKYATEHRNIRSILTILLKKNAKKNEKIRQLFIARCSLSKHIFDSSDKLIRCNIKKGYDEIEAIDPEFKKTSAIVKSILQAAKSIIYSSPNNLINDEKFIIWLNNVILPVIKKRSNKLGVVEDIPLLSFNEAFDYGTTLYASKWEIEYTSCRIKMEEGNYSNDTSTILLSASRKEYVSIFKDFWNEFLCIIASTPKKYLKVASVKQKFNEYLSNLDIASIEQSSPYWNEFDYGPLERKNNRIYINDKLSDLKNDCR